MCCYDLTPSSHSDSMSSASAAGVSSARNRRVRTAKRKSTSNECSRLRILPAVYRSVSTVDLLITVGHFIFHCDQSLRPDWYAKRRKTTLQTDHLILLANAERSWKFSAFGPWRLSYRPKLQHHSWCICIVYICESWSDLVWYFGLKPEFSITSRFAYSLGLRPNCWSQSEVWDIGVSERLTDSVSSVAMFFDF